MFSIVVATDLNLGIGKDNTLPWRIKKDMNYFKDLTIEKNPEEIKKKYEIWDGENYIPAIFNQNSIGNAVIMGRKTWDSIPLKFRPLDKRRNRIVSGTMEEPNKSETFDIFRDFNSSIIETEAAAYITNIYVIGGTEIYRQAIEHPQCSRIYQTVIYKEFDCDTFFPDPRVNFQEIASSTRYEENGLEFQFKILGRK